MVGALKLCFHEKNAGLKKNMKARAEDLTHKCFTDFWSIDVGNSRLKRFSYRLTLRCELLLCEIELAANYDKMTGGLQFN